MNKPIYPCDACETPDSTNCKKCDPWRVWYIYRQSLINAYAAQLDRYWRYYLP